MRTSSIGISLGAALATLALSLGAAAQDAPPATPPPPPAPPPAAPATAAPAPVATETTTTTTTTKTVVETHEEHDPNHRTVAFGVDAVIGFRSASSSSEPVEVPLAATKTVTSLVFGVLWHPTKHFAIGARMPLVFASFAPGVDATSTVTAGNLEIAPEYVTHPSPTTRLALEFGLALPTAGGDEFRCNTVDTQQNGPGGFVQTDCAKSGFSSAQRKAGALEGASLSRGLEDSALFARHRIGFIPKISFQSDKNGVEAGVSTKLEFLQRLNGVLPDSNYDKNATETEWVTAIHGFYHVVPQRFDLGLRAWVVGILEEDFHIVQSPPSKLRAQVAVEPALRLHADPLHVGAGFILPVGGPAGHDYGYKAVRLFVGAAF